MNVITESDQQRSSLSPVGRLFRLAAYASLAGVAYAIWRAMTVGGLTTMVYLILWLPIFAGLATVLFICSSYLIEARTNSPETVVAARRRLSLLVDFIVGAGVIALLIEGVVIWFEGKHIQTIELTMLAVGVVVFRFLMRRLADRTQYIVNIVTICALSLIAVFWFSFLEVILDMFDAG